LTDGQLGSSGLTKHMHCNQQKMTNKMKSQTTAVSNCLTGLTF